LVWQGRFNPVDGASFAAFMAGLERAEQQALVRLQTQPQPPGSVEEAKQALEALELNRLQHLIRSAQTQMKQPGITAERAAALQGQIVAFHKEYLDRRAGKQDTT
jgi:hypothetical protein